MEQNLKKKYVCVCIYIYLNHFSVQLKLTLYCKVNYISIFKNLLNKL